jgi:rhodanese-related sulfurtransferase
MDAFITAAALRQSLGSGQPPLVIDVRRQPAFLGAPDMVRGALRRDPGKVDLWKDTLPAGREVVVYCVHGHEVSQNAAKALGARFLEGGIEAWRTAGGELSRKPAGASSRWITRERPKIDRVACPWLIRRFIDPSAEFLFVPVADVRRIGAEREAVAYDIPEVKFSHEGERCSFDAFLKAFFLGEPALDELARIVRGADTDRLDLAAQSAGLLAVSLGLSRLYKDDHEMLEHGMVVYDALYAWCKGGKEETHTWNPTAYK